MGRVKKSSRGLQPNSRKGVSWNGLIYVGECSYQRQGVAVTGWSSIQERSRWKFTGLSSEHLRVSLVLGLWVGQDPESLFLCSFCKVTIVDHELNRARGAQLPRCGQMNRVESPQLMGAS